MLSNTHLEGECLAQEKKWYNFTERYFNLEDYFVLLSAHTLAVRNALWLRMPGVLIWAHTTHGSPSDIPWPEATLRLDWPLWFLWQLQGILSNNHQGTLKKQGLLLRALRGYTARPGPHSTVTGKGERKSADPGLYPYWGPGWGD